MRRRWRACVVTAALAVVSATTLAAQAFRAEVSDLATGRPLPGVLLQIKDTTGTVLAERLTDSAGFVTGRVFAGATVIFALARIGYRPFISDPVVIPDTGTTWLSFGLEAGPYQLPDLETRAAAATILDRNGFTERARSGFGHFVGPDAIAARRGAAQRVVDYLMTVPGVTIAPTLRGGAAIRFTGIGSVSARCGTPRVFIDGIVVTVEEIDDAVSPGDVLAIEVYRRPAEIPTVFGGPASGCGVVAIWSRRGVR